VREERLCWPDALNFGELGWPYIAVNQFHRGPALNNGLQGAEWPFLVLRIHTGTEPIAGR